MHESITWWLLHCKSTINCEIFFFSYKNELDDKMIFIFENVSNMGCISGCVAITISYPSNASLIFM